MAVELVTGYSGTEHVSSSDDGARQAGTVGTGMYVLETVEDPLAATLENANTVTVGPGDVLINGRHVRLTGSTTYAVPVGTQAMQTSNLLVLRYSVNDDGTEKVEAVTLTGEPATSDPADPALATGSILDGDSPVDMELYRVVTTGIESAQPVRLFSTVPPIADLTLGNLPGSLTSDQLPVVPVSKGGTGATDVATALSNLRAAGLEYQVKSAYVRGYGGNGQDRVTLFMTDNSGNNAALAGYDEFVGLFLNGSWKWQLFPDAAVNGVFKSGRGTISDLSHNTLYNLAPGTYHVMNNATNGPESGNYGNLLVSYNSDNRIVGLLAYDNGHVYTTYGASSSGSFSWTRLDNGAYGKLLWSGSWSRGEVTIPGVNQYRVLAASVANSDHRLVGVNTGDGTISLFANDCWGDNLATSMAVSACRLMRTGSSETLTYSAGGRINLGNDYSYGYGVINSVWGVA